MNERKNMKKLISIIILIVLTVFLADCSRIALVEFPQNEPEISIIPKPLKIERLAGSFTISPQARIFIPTDSPDVERVAFYLAEQLKTVSDFEMEIHKESSQTEANAIIFNKIQSNDLGPEGYRLQVKEDSVTIEANESQGLLYGVQTLFQLLPPEIYSLKKVQEVSWTIPCVQITDKPRYRWRGMMLDVSRHFFPKSFVKDFIDYLAMHRMNTFHWHLCDDQGWRIEIKKYPRLIEVGAWRVDREREHWNSRKPQQEGESATYGGFYTQQEIKEIVAYAQSRFITIVPEIEMPGHCLAALASYPQYSCRGGPFTVPPGSVWPIKDVYCPGNDETFEFLQNVLAEVIELFPGEFIHVGGDEVDKSTWKICPKCQARIASEGLKNEEELQSYFIKRVEKFLNSKKRRLIGWDEILEGGLAPKASVMSWRGIAGGIAAARLGHDVVMTPTSHCYFDYYQGSARREPLAIGGLLPLGTVYSFEPTPEELSPEEASHIFGAQANLWTEFVPTPAHAEFMILPRMAALAEVAWSAKELKNWQDFVARLKKQLRRYVRAGTNYAKRAYYLTNTELLSLRISQ